MNEGASIISVVLKIVGWVSFVVAFFLVFAAFNEMGKPYDSSGATAGIFIGAMAVAICNGLLLLAIAYLLDAATATAYTTAAMLRYITAEDAEAQKPSTGSPAPEAGTDRRRS